MRLGEAGRRYWPWLAIPVLAGPACWTYANGFPHTSDGVAHLLRTLLLDINIRQGIFYPRWVPQLMLGYGYPLFNFYGPTTYYLAVAFHRLGLGYYQSLEAAFVAMVIAAGYGMYLLAGAVFGESGAPWPAFAAGVAYMYAPYLLTNVFMRAAIAEVGAQALLPWIFWSFNRIIKQPQPGRWVLPLSLSLGGLAATHDITLLFVPLPLIAYGAVLWWQTGRERRRLAWVVVGLAAAMGVSAFFWAPLLGERQYLAQTAYALARRYLAENAWTWTNFLDLHLNFEYTLAIPFQLGLVQLVLAVTGYVLARRRDAEWIYWLLLATAASLGIGAWTVPIWLGSDILLVAQFPWRLLTLLSVALTLFTGGVISRFAWPRWLPAAGVLLVALVVWANAPRIDSTTDNDVATMQMESSTVATFEAVTGGFGTGSTHEFTPVWAQALSLDPASAGLPDGSAVPLTLTQASAYERVLQASSPRPFTLRFSDFYFPGWRVYLDGRQALNAYPSTNMGLLTVDVPAGTHQIRVVWQGTTLANLATDATLVTLLLLAVFQWAQPRRWLAVVPAALFMCGAFVVIRPRPRPETVRPALQPLEQMGVRLLGYLVERSGPDALYLYPYWQVNQRPAQFRAHWQLTDTQGRVVTEAGTEPYFGTMPSTNWPAGSLVDDAYRLRLAPGLAAGQYDLWLTLEPVTTTTTTATAAPNFVHIANLALTSIPPAPPHPPWQAINAQFGQTIVLAGYTVSGASTAAPAQRPVLKSGDEIDYTLYWRAAGILPENYHGYVHLLNVHQQPIAKTDQQPGGWLRPPFTWNAYDPQADTYRLTIPLDAPGGLYWPRVGLYDFVTLASLPITDAAGKAIGSSLDLPPIKVVPPAPRPPEHLTTARFSDLATLWGYNLSLPVGGLRAGAAFTLTLFYRGSAPDSVDYTHFVHLSGADGRVAAQDDAQPQQGINPTSTWVAGEVIVDPIVMTIAPDAPAGTYTLSTGLYDPAASGARLAVLDPDGNELPDDSVVLTTLPVEP